jgi:hypothetical protein
MGSHSQENNRASIRKEKKAALLKSLHTTHTSLSEPEDSMSSGVESFDEADMYPADYDDEAVSNSPDSDRRSESLSNVMVCPLLRLSSPAVSHPK